MSKITKNQTQNKSNIENVMDFISEKYEIRYNVVSNRIEYYPKKSKAKKWEELNENNILIDLQINHFKISQANLLALLRSDFVQKHNPFIEYFESLGDWDGKDYIQELAKYIEVKPRDQDRFNRQFKKMFVRMIASALEVHLNKQAFVLVHNKQNSGKSTFLRWLCPPKLERYFTEDITLDKDGLIALAENFIINLDELSILSKRDLNALKSMMSKDVINERLPYDKKSSLLKRRCNFVGSTNNEEFLTDATGSVRWVCFDIDNIVWSYKTDIDINKVYTQAYALFKQGFEYQLNRSEIQENEIANQSFLIRTPEMEWLQHYLKPSDKNSPNAIFLTASEIVKAIQEKTDFTVKINNNNMGKALAILGFQRTSAYRSELGYSPKGYYVEKRQVINFQSENTQIEAIQEKSSNNGIISEQKIPF